ncbi:MFS transporter [Aspergillus saccharolyticus JOP 1030-1]|uniref:MFS transporter n=1 Tax=Aspergillus saccharolyticus JOP 1030-1 TaxID=1450539 RepID=A0A318ZIF6_9EURO|nr:MFS transporter [Aspergillus saccharolyticus JOP 1030-1]PYH47361.1 MFS transporter [Aspergillus saccharolyticus JOP 1030-1]
MAPSRIDSPEVTPLPSTKLQSSQKQETRYGDFRDDFFRDGYAVIKGALTPERAKEYQSRALDWLESFGLGFDRNDKSTWKKENLPQSWKGGMYLHFSAAHEKYVWDVRCEPGVIAPFAKLWETDELVVSFDTVNITLPQSIVGEYDSKPWPHVDQAPERRGMNCVQGIVNLSKAGPEDGGLVVMKGSAPLFDQFFAENPVTGPTPWRTAKHKDFHPFSEENLEWYRAHGCELIKVCAEPGDLIIWDSRQIHWAQFGESDVVRTIVYTTYTPAKWMSEEDRKKKTELFEQYETTTHWPHTNLYTHGKATVTVDGEERPDPLERDEPLTKPVRTEQLLQLADPLNLPQWHKWVITCVLGVFSILGVLLTSGMGPFVTTMQAYYDYDTRVNDLMTYPTLFMGIGNLLAMPMAMAVGRRPIFLASALILTVGAIWCAVSGSLGSHIAARDVLSLAAGQSEALCPLIIQEIHFVHERSSRLAWFSAIQSIGSAALTIATSYLVIHLGWRWWYGIFAIASGFVFIVALLLGEEVAVVVHATTKHPVPLDYTRYQARTVRYSLQIFHGPANWRAAARCWKQMSQCILFPNILWVVLMNSIALGIYVIGTTEYATLLAAPPYSYPDSSLGLVQGGQIVVSMLMVPLLGYGGDQLHKWIARRRDGVVAPEMRLIPIVLPVAVVLISAVIYGRAGSHPTEWSSWAIVTTFNGMYFGFIGIVLNGFTYSLDSYGERAAPILVLICAIRGLISFGISFGITSFIAQRGYQGSFNICAIIMGVISAGGLPVFILGPKIRALTMKYAVDGRRAEI